jgi:phosphoglycolate phosphatase-like HAD superfamily hydrolase
MKLLLFDIDGTLLTANGTGRSSVEAALSRQFGRPIHTDAVAFSGKTDPQIMAEVLRENDIPPTDEHVDTALATYQDTAHPALSADTVTVLPGVAALVDALHDRSDVHLGIVTGNVERMAYRKLEAARLDAPFPFGAFGSDHADRNRLPPLAIDRAAAYTGHRFDGSDVVVIGDTARDIECGARAGAYVVGVCTGHYTRDDLAPHGPDLLLDDLRDLDRFVQQVVER